MSRDEASGKDDPIDQPLPVLAGGMRHMFLKPYMIYMLPLDKGSKLSVFHTLNLKVILFCTVKKKANAPQTQDIVKLEGLFIA